MKKLLKKVQADRDDVIAHRERLFDEYQRDDKHVVSDPKYNELKGEIAAYSKIIKLIETEIENIPKIARGRVQYIADIEENDNISLAGLTESPVCRTIIKLPRNPRTISPQLMYMLSNSQHCVADFVELADGEKYGIEHLTEIILEIAGLFDDALDLIDAVPNPWKMVDEAGNVITHAINTFECIDTGKERELLWAELKDISKDEAIELIKTLIEALFLLKDK